MHKYTDYAHQVVFASRRNLETLVRRAVCASSPSIEFVQGLVTDFKVLDGRVEAVSVRSSGGTTTELPCALVVGASVRDEITVVSHLATDCTGNTQAGLKCLTRALPTLPAGMRDEYNPKLNFTSFEFPVPANFEENLRALGIRDASGNLVDTSECAWFHIHGPDPELDYRTVFLGRSDHGRSASSPGVSVALRLTHLRSRRWRRRMGQRSPGHARRASRVHEQGHRGGPDAGAHLPDPRPARTGQGRVHRVSRQMLCVFRSCRARSLVSWASQRRALVCITSALRTSSRRTLWPSATR